MYSSFVTIDDIFAIERQTRRPGCEKGVLQAEPCVQSAVFRVAPGSGVPPHFHTSVHDMFIGVRGLLEIRYEGEGTHGVFVLKAGAFCALPPHMRHEVYNPSQDEDAYFISIHTPHTGYDFIPDTFRLMDAALGGKPYDASQVQTVKS